MDNAPYQKLLSPALIALGVGLSIGVFILMSILLVPYTFSPEPLIAQLQACFAAVPIAATFWLACNMFMIVLMDQKKKRQEPN